MDKKRSVDAWSKRTYERTGADLRFFAAEAPNVSVELITVKWIENYLERMKDLSLASQKSRYGAVREWLRWLTRRGYLAKNPSDTIDQMDLPWIGRRARRRLGRGKPQLRNVQEAKAYLDTALALPKIFEAVAGSLPLLCGLRSGEVRHLQVADIDFDVGKIWIRSDEHDEDEGWDVKTAASARTVDLPSELISHLRSLCDERQPHDYVFSSSRSQGGPYERKWLNRLVKRICEKANVRIICAHGLRDTYTSLQAALGQRSAAEIAELIGHADDGKTAKAHYIGVPEHTAALRVVQGGAM